MRNKKNKIATCAEPIRYSQWSWRLVDQRDAICQTDEVLCGDCETWLPLDSNSPYIGQAYNGNHFVPMRRKSRSEIAEGMQIKQVKAMANTPLSEEQLKHWRNVLFDTIGVWALTMPDEEVQQMRDELQRRSIDDAAKGPV